MRKLAGKCIPLFLAGILTVMACEEDITSQEVRFTAEESFTIEIERKTHTALTLTGINGDVEITGDPGAAVISVTGVKSVESDSFEDAEARLDEIEVVVDSTNAAVSVWTVQPDTTENRDYTVDYTITLPQDFEITLINANGDVKVQSISADVMVQCANSEIHGSAIIGNTSMSAANGRIDTSVTLPAGGRIALDMANGDVILRIPVDTSAEFSATVANGSIDLKNLELSDMIQTATTVQGTLGNGDGVIAIGVANGTITAEGLLSRN